MPRIGGLSGAVLAPASVSEFFPHRRQAAFREETTNAPDWPGRCRMDMQFATLRCWALLQRHLNVDLLTVTHDRRRDLLP